MYVFIYFAVFPEQGNTITIRQKMFIITSQFNFVIAIMRGRVSAALRLSFSLSTEMQVSAKSSSILRKWGGEPAGPRKCDKTV